MLNFDVLDKDSLLLSNSELSSLVGEVWNPLNKSNVNQSFSNAMAKEIWEIIHR